MNKQHKWKYENCSFEQHINELKHLIRVNKDEIRNLQAKNDGIQECIDLLEKNIEEVKNGNS